MGSEEVTPHRRAEDPRIQKLVEDVEQAMASQRVMQASIDQNTALTAGMKGTVDEVKDILTSFRVLSNVAKWLAAIGSAVGAIAVAWKQIKGGG